MRKVSEKKVKTNLGIEGDTKKGTELNSSMEKGRGEASLLQWNYKEKAVNASEQCLLPFGVTN